MAHSNLENASLLWCLFLKMNSNVSLPLNINSYQTVFKANKFKKQKESA